MAIAAQNIYYAGYPSRTTLDLYFPRGIVNISAVTVTTPEGAKSELVLNMERSGVESSILTVLPFEINTTITPGFGRKFVLIKAEQSGYINFTS